MAGEGSHAGSTQEDESNSEQTDVGRDGIGSPAESGHAGHCECHGTGAEGHEDAAEQRRRRDFLKDAPHNRHKQGSTAADNQDECSCDQRRTHQAELAHCYTADHHRSKDEREALREIGLETNDGTAAVNNLALPHETEMTIKEPMPCRIGSLEFCSSEHESPFTYTRKSILPAV